MMALVSALCSGPHVTLKFLLLCQTTVESVGVSFSCKTFGCWGVLTAGAWLPLDFRPDRGAVRSATSEDLKVHSGS